MKNDPFIFTYRSDPVNYDVRIENGDPDPKEGDFWCSTNNARPMIYQSGEWREITRSEFPLIVNLHERMRNR